VFRFRGLARGCRSRQMLQRTRQIPALEQAQLSDLAGDPRATRDEVGEIFCGWRPVFQPVGRELASVRGIRTRRNIEKSI
jgi:hypothetical protein